MPKIYLQNSNEEYEHVEVMPSGWVRAWDWVGERNRKHRVRNYPPNRVQYVEGECKYNTEK